MSEIISFEEIQKKQQIDKLRERVCNAIDVNNFCKAELIAMFGHRKICQEAIGKIMGLGISFEDKTSLGQGRLINDIEDFIEKYPNINLGSCNSLEEICEMETIELETLLAILNFCDSYLINILLRNDLSEIDLLKCIEQALITRGYNFVDCKICEDTQKFSCNVGGILS